MAGGLSAAIGIAINYGFKKAILVGCDYLLDPVRGGHFYTLPLKLKMRKDLLGKDSLILHRNS